MVVEGVMSESQTLRNSEYSMKATSVEKSFEIRADSNQENLTVNRDEIKLAVDKLNQLAEPIRRKVKFELHD